MLETIYSAEYHYGANNPYIICDLSSPPGTPDYLLNPHLVSLILGTCRRLHELPRPSCRAAWNRVIHPVSAFKRARKMQQSATDLYLNVHVRRLARIIIFFYAAELLYSLGNNSSSAEDVDFQCKWSIGSQDSQDSSCFFITLKHFNYLETVEVLTALRQQRWDTPLPKGTAGYWTHVKLIITRRRNFMGNSSLLRSAPRCEVDSSDFGQQIFRLCRGSSRFAMHERHEDSSYLCSSNVPERNQSDSRARRSPTNINNYFSFTFLRPNYERPPPVGWSPSVPGGGAAGIVFFFVYVRENNGNLQITNVAGLCSVISAGKTLEHRELQLICVIWQRLPGSVKYLSVYFSKCGNIFIAWSGFGSSERMQIPKRTHMHASTHTPPFLAFPPILIYPARLFCPWWKWLHASLIPAAHLYSQQPTFNMEVPLS